MNNTKITELATPTVGTDAATKSYADSIVGAGGAHAESHRDGTDQLLYIHNSVALMLVNDSSAAETLVDAGLGTSPAYVFDANTTEYADYAFNLDADQYPTSGGGDLAIAFKYSMSAGHATSTMVFGVNWRAIQEGQSVAGGESGSDSVTLLRNNTNMWNSYTDLIIPATEIKKNDLIILNFYREVGIPNVGNIGELYLYDVWIKEQ
jgi:hypothetical protein